MIPGAGAPPASRRAAASTRGDMTDAPPDGTRRSSRLALSKICITVTHLSSQLRGKPPVTSNPQSTTQRWSRWQEVRPQSVSSRIVDQVRAALFRGELKPGDLLGSETDLAKRFGVSRVPVRDAFKTLQALGIVEVKMGANGGARIAAGDPNRFADALAVQLKLVGIGIEEMFDAQIAIEVMATELAAKRASTADLAKLRSILRELQAMAQKPLTASAAARFTETAMHFHAG